MPVFTHRNIAMAIETTMGNSEQHLIGFTIVRIILGREIRWHQKGVIVRPWWMWVKAGMGEDR